MRTKIVLLFVFLFLLPLVQMDNKDIKVTKVPIVLVKDSSNYLDPSMSLLRWYALLEGDKYKLILNMVKVGDGAVLFNITNEDSTLEQMASELILLKNCVDSCGFVYYNDFRQDVEIGSVIINCFARRGMFN